MRCLNCFPSLLANWLPDGKEIGGEWVARNPTRQDRRAGSFKINVKTGRWSDFATGDSGGDPISLYAYLNGLKQIEAARELRSILGGAV
ncbi:MAG: hypothetical protein JKY41_13925 [Rhodobacteraceae bacterium]|nr:hypothetical protein [Paracoccaceae bacterium]